MGLARVNVSIFGALHPSQSGLIHKHIVEHIASHKSYDIHSIVREVS